MQRDSIAIKARDPFCRTHDRLIGNDCLSGTSWFLVRELLNASCNERLWVLKEILRKELEFCGVHRDLGAGILNTILLYELPSVSIVSSSFLHKLLLAYLINQKPLLL